MVRSRNANSAALSCGVAATVVLALALGTSVARAQPGHAPVHATAEAVSDSDVAHRLSHDLACMCGECDRLPLADCRCMFAAEEREKITAMLQDHDVATRGGRDAAYQAIVDAYVQRFGPAVLTAASSTQRESALHWLLPMVVAVVGLGSLIAAVEHIQRRLRARSGKPGHRGHRSVRKPRRKIKSR